MTPSERAVPPSASSASETEIMIETQNLSQTFIRANGSPVTVARDMNVKIRRGEFVCIIGPSGCGKTTFLHIVAGLLKPTSGTVVVAGSPVRGPGPDRGVVFQKDSVFPWMRVINNVEYGLACRGLPQVQRRAIARHYLSAVGLSQVEHSWPRELSGGMLKRVAVATVFANGAEVLLLDEPFGPLDYLTRRQLHSVLLNLWAEAESGNGVRRTVLFVTHDIDEALTLSDRILIMKAGRIVEDVANKLQRPRTDDDLAQPEALAYRHLLLQHLIVEQSIVGPAGSNSRNGRQ